eukprot:TRINITY_DN4537_c0_g1_i1.p1 TRINITY_DN4537_c0_g1~~TRINITY_DN4537_c0_g1_i1.p1  ORF type:complete len:901 (+),score=235.86 TRINITY_DN4537_c0_g1_i1:118-2820(+)
MNWKLNLFGLFVLFQWSEIVHSRYITADEMYCYHGGVYQSLYPDNYPDGKNAAGHYRGTCLCPEGWTGTDCALCTSDASCPKGQFCDRELIIQDMGAWNCSIPQSNFFAWPGSITAEFFNMSTGSGTARVQVFKGDSVNIFASTPKFFNCSLWDCKRSLVDPKMTVGCDNVKCFCTDWCDGEAYKAIVNAMSGYVEISCDLNTGGCKFVGRGVPLSFKCKAASCQSARYEPASPTRFTYEVRLVLFICVLFFFLLFCALLALTIAIVRPMYNYDIPPLEKFEFQASLSWHNVSCTITNAHNGKQRTILNNIDGIAKSGQLTAILGPSGGGKTTFLDILAGRKNTGTIRGDILVNGALKDATFPRLTGYVMQDDKILGTLTAKEHLQYVAALKLPSEFTWAQREAKISSVLEDLGISHISDTLIGTEMTRGISGGEKRRLSIASELVSNPSILFLDEPTSGLDSHTSYSLLKTLKKLAVERHKTIIMSIHQPSSSIYNTFDNVMLLSKGEAVYFGPRENVDAHLESMGYHMPSHYNPADYLLDVVTMNNQETIRSMSRSYRDSEIHRRVIIDMDIVKEVYFKYRPLRSLSAGTSDESPNSAMDSLFEMKYTPPSSELKKKYAASWLKQVYLVSHRTFINNFRNPYLLRFQYIVTVALGLILGIVYWHLGNDLPAAQNRLGAIFFIIALLSFGSMSSLDVFFNERSLFVRERANGMYSTSAYFVARAICDLIPMRFFPPIILGTTTYFMIGFDQTHWSSFAWYLYVLVAVSLCAASLCFAVSSFSPSLAFANLLTILLLLFCMLFGGFLVNNDNIPFFIKWLKNGSFLNFGFELLACKQFEGIVVRIHKSGAIIPVIGTEVLSQFHLDPERLQTDFTGLIVWFIFYMILSYICLRFVVKEQR